MGNGGFQLSTVPVASQKTLKLYAGAEGIEKAASVQARSIGSLKTIWISGENGWPIEPSAGVTETTVGGAWSGMLPVWKVVDVSLSVALP